MEDWRPGQMVRNHSGGRAPSFRFARGQFLVQYGERPIHPGRTAERRHERGGAARPLPAAARAYVVRKNSRLERQVLFLEARVGCRSNSSVVATNSSELPL